MHVLVCVTTGLFLGGHLQQQNGSALKSTRKLISALAGPEAEGESFQLKNTIDADRAYCTNDFLEYATRHSVKVTGAKKRGTTNPYVDKNTSRPTSTQVLLDNVGTKRTWWKRRKLPRECWPSSTPQYEYFMACRTGLGRIFFMTTTDISLASKRVGYRSLPQL